MSTQNRPIQPKLKLSFSQTFIALKYPNYRLWFYGQMVSLIGTWMQSTAQGFFVFELTHSAAYLGYVGFAAGLPAWLFTLYGGVIADRIPRRRLLLYTQTAMMVLAFTLALLTFTKLVQPWHIIVLAFLLGTANAFDAPTRLAFVTELVDREDLTNAIALNATMFNVATALGPAVAGLAYAVFGPAWCFIINGLSFIAVIASLMQMQLAPLPRVTGGRSVLEDFRAGLAYVASHRMIRMLIANLVVVSLFGIGFYSLLPAWAVKVLGGDETTNGFLQSARGVGALVSALMIASMGRFNGRGKLFTLGSLVFPVMMFVFVSMHNIPMALISLAALGWGQMALLNSSNALVQTNTPDQLRGRVMGLYSLGFFGFMPIGALLAGLLAENLGEPVAGTVGSLTILAFAIYLVLKVPELRSAD